MKNQLSKALTLIVLLLGAVGIMYTVVQSGKTSKPSSPVAGMSAPVFTISNLEGQRVNLKELRGKVVLVNFWGSWCAPCRDEMPEIEKAYQQYKDQGFTVLAINIGESRVTAKGFADRLGLTFPILLDSDRHVTSDLYNIGPIPTSYFIDKNGIISSTFTGPMTLSYITTKIQTLLAQ